MPWYHHIAAFLSHNWPQVRATRRTNPTLLTTAILNRRALSLSELARPGDAPMLPPAQKTLLSLPLQTQPPLCPDPNPMRLDTYHLPAGRTPIMIDWSDLGPQRNGLFAAVCFRKRGLPLHSWATLPDELNPS